MVVAFDNGRDVGPIVYIQAFADEWRVDAGATLKLQMLRFVNPGGKDSDGDCCDKTLWWCSGKCDHIFRFALDRGNRCVCTEWAKRQDHC